VQEKRDPLGEKFFKMVPMNKPKGIVAFDLGRCGNDLFLKVESLNGAMLA